MAVFFSSSFGLGSKEDSCQGDRELGEVKVQIDFGIFVFHRVEKEENGQKDV